MFRRAVPRPQTDGVAPSPGSPSPEPQRHHPHAWALGAARSTLCGVSSRSSASCGVLAVTFLTADNSDFYVIKGRRRDSHSDLWATQCTSDELFHFQRLYCSSSEEPSFPGPLPPSLCSVWLPRLVRGHLSEPFTSPAGPRPSRPLGRRRRPPPAPAGPEAGRDRHSCLGARPARVGICAQPCPSPRHPQGQA